MQDVRDWILSWAKLKAVISLPQATFSPYGAGVKTSVLVLEKLETAFSAKGLFKIRQEVIETETDEDYKVYMAQINDIGYDATGRLTIAEDSSSRPPEIDEVVNDFSEKLGW